MGHKLWMTGVTVWLCSAFNSDWHLAQVGAVIAVIGCVIAWLDK